MMMMHATSTAEDFSRPGGIEDFSSRAHDGKKNKNKKKPHSFLVLLIMLSGLGAMVSFYDYVLDGMKSSGGERIEDHRALMVDERMLEVIKEAWPECVDQHMNGISCKTFIDEEILSLLTGDDKLTRTVLVEKRQVLDVFYNAVVILMDDDDRTVGKDGDGVVYYPFPWVGSGEEATPEEQTEIPPVIATDTNSTDEPLIFEDAPTLVEGATLAEATQDLTQSRSLAEGAVKPIAGGVVIDPTTPNCNPDSDIALQDALTEARLQPIEPAGERDLPAFDCTCLTGYACCLLIKTLVRDADIYNKAIQCHLNFAQGTAKSKLFDNGRGKKVKIYTNHNFVVNKIPFVEGSWVYDNGEATE